MDTHTLKLDKSLYELKEAPRLWFEHCAKVLKKLGMKQSKHDKCLLYGDNIVVVQYVDDGGISAPT